MKKTHSAHIGGTVFQIEDDAYEMLQDYLQSIETHFHFYPDVKEIVSDIEGRIAEQLQLHDAAPQVVRLADVERVIATMGRTEQFADPEPQVQAPQTTEVRRLFRDPDNKIISGVAAGLAAYLGLPRLLVRLALVALLFTFGISALLYLLLWALVPMASTTTDRMQMRGRPLTLASIDEDVRDGIAALPPATRNMATRGVLAAGSLIHLVVTTVVRVAARVAGVLVVGGASLAMLFFTVVLVVALVNAAAPPLHADVSAFLASFGKWQLAFKICVYLLLIIPLALVAATGLRLFWGARQLNSHGLAGLLGVWVISLLAASAIWSNSYPALRTYWSEYPALTESRRQLERFSTMVATTSPLTEGQSQTLLSLMITEQKRSNMEDRSRYTYGAEARLAYEQARLGSTEESHRRILESAQAHLDDKQMTMLREFMAQSMHRAQASVQARQQRLDARGLDARGLDTRTLPELELP